ncbi:hypothetical protein N7478_000663 [Penicillium angulare]|uniref:uncharacterized protein n=1 Tax=Penicillium angulare TaxID=116970 RepID=UPI0025416213|nr:uncharacterized protein N7478_000663 [Penicillium angulare]KAJ5291412.1 hypothetical protein N7478_000663 [Penicillium angulare]
MEPGVIKSSLAAVDDEHSLVLSEVASTLCDRADADISFSGPIECPELRFSQDNSASACVAQNGQNFPVCPDHRDSSLSFHPWYDVCALESTIRYHGCCSRLVSFNLPPAPPLSADFVNGLNFLATVSSTGSRNFDSSNTWEAGRYNSQIVMGSVQHQDIQEPSYAIHNVAEPHHAGLENVWSSMPQQQKFQCSHPGCRSYFRRRKSFARHLTSHLEVRPHVCWVPDCHRKFSRRDNLNAHYVTHGKRNGRNRYVATLDRANPVYNPTFCGQLTPDGCPIESPSGHVLRECELSLQ